MSVSSDGGDPVDIGRKRKGQAKKRKLAFNDSGLSDNYKMYTKPNYKRQFPENHSVDCVVYVESTEDEKLGNKNPMTLTKLFTENVKGIVGVHRVNAYKIGITFRKPAPANNFLKMDHFLNKNKFRAFVPAYLSEKTGVIRYVPTDMSNEDIYKNISCDAEVISIKRFMRKVDGILTPLGTVAVTFAATTLPQYVYIQLFRYPVHTYIPPLVQCFKCLKFNHSAKVCRAVQMCSSCAGQHSYKECDVDTIMCINCGGNHLAISRNCPIKRKKMEEKRNKYLNLSYATVVSIPSNVSESKNFPNLEKSSNVYSSQLNSNVNKSELNKDEIVNNDIIINALVKSLVALGNNNEKMSITHKKIKEILLSNLT